MGEKESIQYHQKHLKNWQEFFLACNELGYHTFVVGHCRHFGLFVGYMYTDLGLCLLRMVSTTGNKAGSGWKIV